MRLRSTSHRAKVRRLSGASVGSGLRNAGTPGATALPGLRKSPRLRMCVGRGQSRSSRTSWIDAFGMLLQSASILVVGLLPFGTVVRQ